MTRQLGFAIALLVLTATGFGQTTKPVATPRPAQQSQKDVKRLVYFVDVSGKTLPIMAGLRDQLKQSISALTAEQEFNVVLLRAGKLTSFDPKLVTAAPEHKTKFYDYINKVTSQGKSSLLPLADYLKTGDADLCYVLVSDGMQDVDPTMARVKKEYKGHTGINFIFITKDGTSPMVKTYQKIADEYGGTLRIIEADKF